MLKGRINIEGSGNAEWLRCTKPNNSLNRSANSAVFMRETMLVIMVRRARLIRALGTPERDDMTQAGRTCRVDMPSREAV